MTALAGSISLSKHTPRCACGNPIARNTATLLSGSHGSEGAGPMTSQEWLKREGICGFQDDAMWASLMEAYAAHVNKELVKAKTELVKAITNALGFLSLHRPETAKLVLSDALAKYG